MKQETPTPKKLAQLVFTDELAGKFDLHELQSALKRIFERLDGHLTIRLGSEGYRTLLRRAVSLAVANAPSLTSVHISPDGALEGFQNVTDSQAVSDGCVAILSRLIELMDTFIGRNLTMRILHNLWPGALQINTAGGLEESNG